MAPLPTFPARARPPSTNCWRASWRSTCCAAGSAGSRGSVFGDGRLRRQVLAALLLPADPSQVRSVEEILADMATPTRMLRLLQGDVGSGKTVVALMAMLAAVEAGEQAALMAPTDLLARQHHARLAPLAAAAGLEVGFLSGRDKGKAREATLGRLADGSLRLVVGTHALFQEEVQFQALGLAVIDEQHRFGVHQRLMLARAATRSTCGDDGDADPAHSC
jgi:ATP-dependent DNA helicase RecG